MASVWGARRWTLRASIFVFFEALQGGPYVPGNARIIRGFPFEIASRLSSMHLQPDPDSLAPPSFLISESLTLRMSDSIPIVTYSIHNLHLHLIFKVIFIFIRFVLFLLTFTAIFIIALFTIALSVRSVIAIITDITPPLRSFNVHHVSHVNHNYHCHQLHIRGLPVGPA